MFTCACIISIIFSLLGTLVYLTYRANWGGVPGTICKLNIFVKLKLCNIKAHINVVVFSSRTPVDDAVYACIVH